MLKLFTVFLQVQALFLASTNPLKISELESIRYQTSIPKIGAICDPSVTSASTIKEIHDLIVAEGEIDMLEQAIDPLGFMASQLSGQRNASPQVLPPVQLIFETWVKCPDGIRQIGYQAKGRIAGKDWIGTTQEELDRTEGEMKILDAESRSYSGWWDKPTRGVTKLEEVDQSAGSGPPPLVPFQDRDYY